jgi:hypothetical protein
MPRFAPKPHLPSISLPNSLVMVHLGHSRMAIGVDRFVVELESGDDHGLERRRA